MANNTSDVLYSSELQRWAVWERFVDECPYKGQCNEKPKSVLVLKSSLPPTHPFFINPHTFWSITFIRKIKKCLVYGDLYSPSKTYTVELLQFAYSQDVIITQWGLAQPAQSLDETAARKEGWGDRPGKIDKALLTGAPQTMFNLGLIHWV